MIRADDKGVLIQGSTETIAFDFTMIIKGVYSVLAEDIGEEYARHMIADLGKIAFFEAESDEELTEKFDALAAEWEGVGENAEA